MRAKPRHRIATDAALQQGAEVMLGESQAHYLGHVLRLNTGDAVALFNGAAGEWRGAIVEVKKKSMRVAVQERLRPPAALPDFHAAFAPIKGGRLETIIEKATELGAVRLQPVLTQRTIVDKVNAERAQHLAREAAEQCERTDWPTIDPVRKLAAWLGDLPADRLLIYGDESGNGVPITEILNRVAPKLREPRSGGDQRSEGGEGPPSSISWTILAGPEGGFTPEELAMLRRRKNSVAVGLGPRILRADTAIITLAAVTLAAWGDWHLAPRFEGS